MSLFLDDLEATDQMLDHPLIYKELIKARVRSQSWIKANSHALQEAGWTVEKLYLIGALPYPYSEWGPGWLTLWNSEKCEPRLGSRGSIEFVLHEGGGNVVQTCWLDKPFLN